MLDLAQPHTNTRLFGLPDFEANRPGFDNNNESGGDHAGKVETSLLWALAPECVDMSRIDLCTRPPHFAMGPDAPESDRRIGERMVEDEVAWLGSKMKALLAEYKDDPAVPGFPTFESVERFWDSQIRPILPELKSMSRDFGRGGEVRADSVWRANWDVPDRR